MNSNCNAVRVLVADDERVIADSLALILKVHGYDAVAAYDGSSALSLAMDFSPQLIVTDVLMPGMSGIALAIRIREALPDCKILLFSGQAAILDLLDDARAHGHIFELITKPVHPKKLLEQLQSMMPADTRAAL